MPRHDTGNYLGMYEAGLGSNCLGLPAQLTLVPDADMFLVCMCLFIVLSRGPARYSLDPLLTLPDGSWILLFWTGAPATTGGTQQLEHGCGVIYAGCPFFLAWHLDAQGTYHLLRKCTHQPVVISGL